MAQQDRSTHDPRTGKKTGSIPLSGKGAPTVTPIPNILEACATPGASDDLLEYSKRHSQYSQTLHDRKKRQEKALEEFVIVPNAEASVKFSIATKDLPLAEDASGLQFPVREVDPVTKRYVWRYPTPMAQWRIELKNLKYHQKITVMDRLYIDGQMAALFSEFRDKENALRASLKEEECDEAFAPLQEELNDRIFIIWQNFNNNLTLINDEYRDSFEELDREIAQASSTRSKEILKERSQSYDYDIDTWFTTVIAQVDARRPLEEDRDEAIFSELKRVAKEAYYDHVSSDECARIIAPDNPEYNLVQALATQDGARVLIAEAAEMQGKVYLERKKAGRSLTTGALPRIDAQWNYRRFS
jgi:hypothetical protein